MWFQTQLPCTALNCSSKYYKTTKCVLTCKKILKCFSELPPQRSQLKELRFLKLEFMNNNFGIQHKI